MTTIVAFQGETGAFSEVAARQLVAEPIALLPCATFDAAVRAVVNGHADYAAIPVTNLIAGPVHEAVDAIAAFPSLERVGEMKLPIHLTLMGVAGATLDDVREVLSHGIALQQCTRFFAEHPEITGVEAHDTAGAARMVAIRRDPSVAALAAAWAAKVYGLAIIAERLEDRADNVTTFVLLRRKPRDLSTGDSAAS
jgi:prephenate dehydratase